MPCNKRKGKRPPGKKVHTDVEVFLPDWATPAKYARTHKIWRVLEKK